MWKILKTIAGVFVSVVILINVGQFFYQVYAPARLTCDSDVGIINKVTNGLSNSPLMKELGLTVTSLNNIQESMYDKGRKTYLCTANAALSNGKNTPIWFKIITKRDGYQLEMQFYEVAKLIFENLSENLENTEDDSEDEVEDVEVDEDDDEEDSEDE